MAIIKLICEQCGGSIALDPSHEVGTCEHCLSQFVIKEEQIVQNITRNITKHVYSIEGKDVEELLSDAHELLSMGSYRRANEKFSEVIKINGRCWEGWLGYADTGASGASPVSISNAYRNAYSSSSNEEERSQVFAHMVDWFPNSTVRPVFVRVFNTASRERQARVFDVVCGMIGCDESEIAHLAIDLAPQDWRATFALAQERQIRARWAKTSRLFKKLPAEAQKVAELFTDAYRLAKNEGAGSEKVIVDYVRSMTKDASYVALAKDLDRRFSRLPD